MELFNNFIQFLNIHKCLSFVLLTSLNLLPLALCVSKLSHTRLLAALYFCLK